MISWDYYIILYYLYFQFLDFLNNNTRGIAIAKNKIDPHKNAHF